MRFAFKRVSASMRRSRSDIALLLQPTIRIGLGVSLVALALLGLPMGPGFGSPELGGDGDPPSNFDACGRVPTVERHVNPAHVVGLAVFGLAVWPTKVGRPSRQMAKKARQIPPGRARRSGLSRQSRRSSMGSRDRRRAEVCRAVRPSRVVDWRSAQRRVCAPGAVLSQAGGGRPFSKKWRSMARTKAHIGRFRCRWATKLTCAWPHV